MADFGLRISDWVAWPTRVIARSAATWQSLADLGLQAVSKALPSAPPGQSLPPVIPRHPRVGGEKAGSRRGRGRGWSILGFGNAEWECHHLPFRVIARSLIDLMRSTNGFLVMTRWVNYCPLPKHQVPSPKHPTKRHNPKSPLLRGVAPRWARASGHRGDGVWCSARTDATVCISRGTTPRPARLVPCGPPLSRGDFRIMSLRGA
jgi:hypothetical protein